MEALAKTRKLGGSLIVTIPKAVVEHEDIGENQVVKINVKKVKKDFFGAFKGIGPFTKEDELDIE
ncbi:MAG: hypothetical protein Q8R00_02575 [Candidatus Nanoarchaeia archaeon]|nr:hypothetical protein [Candidatus Nanoarchaeia archaeon]